MLQYNPSIVPASNYQSYAAFLAQQQQQQQQFIAPHQQFIAPTQQQQQYTGQQHFVAYTQQEPDYTTTPLEEFLTARPIQPAPPTVEQQVCNFLVGQKTPPSLQPVNKPSRPRKTTKAAAESKVCFCSSSSRPNFYVHCYRRTRTPPPPSLHPPPPYRNLRRLWPVSRFCSFFSISCVNLGKILAHFNRPTLCLKRKNVRLLVHQQCSAAVRHAGGGKLDVDAKRKAARRRTSKLMTKMSEIMVEIKKSADVGYDNDEEDDTE